MSDDNCVAVIGMSGRFPAARTLDDYWTRLAAGDECIRFFSRDELDPASRGLAGTSNFVMAAGVLDDIDQFDAPLFRMSDEEAALTDPQHRLFLEAAWTALEDAGYGDPESRPGVAGVYAGSLVSSYAARAAGHVRSARDELHALVASGIDYLPLLTAYKLDLRGESLAVQAACSTSLVAVHLGCQSLLTGQTDLVLAGAASIDPRQYLGYQHEPGTSLSADGHCRPFSAEAQGTPRGFGVGVVALRRLEDAIGDGDPIRAVIRGSAVNNDGRDRIGFTAPSVTGQAHAIATALAMADVPPETIGYVEAHGTATPLGDAVEVEALTRAFKTAHRGFCALGSVKANIGHLSEASGIAALIKTVLALEHGARPGLFNFTTPNPAIDFSRTPFRISRELEPWDQDTPRRAGVSTYAVGGTNAHLVLEEAPPASGSLASAGPWVFVVSAASSEALARVQSQLAAWLRTRQPAALADVAFTLIAGRRALTHRRAIVAATAEDLIRALDDPRGETLTLASGAVPEGLRASAERWLAGSPLDSAWIPAGRRVRLPTYPFDRRSHWLSPREDTRVHSLTWWLDRGLRP